MNLKEFYAISGGDYDGAMARLITEERVKKFVRKFAGDPSYSELIAALDKSDAKAAFLAAHTLKGVCQNLGFDSLYRSSSAITEILRAGSLDVGALPDEIKLHYTTIIDAIGSLE
ncbi:MAG: Hpt domain-containing protein [Clostridiales bacterium]|nr:Hpt domain-containing protein [Clostridiales bacterium]